MNVVYMLATCLACAACFQLSHCSTSLCQKMGLSLHCKGGFYATFPNNLIESYGAIKHLIWENLHVTTLTQLPGSATLLSVTFTSLKVQFAVDAPFSNLSNIENIYLQGCCLNKIPSFQTSSKQVKSIYYNMGCQKNNSNQLSEKLLNFTVILHSVNLTFTNSCLNSISNNTFRHLHNIGRLDLSANNLSGVLPLSNYFFDKNLTGKFNVQIKSLNLSNNIYLESLDFQHNNPHWMVIKEIDFTNTNILLEKINIQPHSVTIIHSFIMKRINRTINFTELNYLFLRIQSVKLILSHMKLTNFQTNFTESTNFCRSRDYKYLSITHAQLTDLSGTMNKTKTELAGLNMIDFSYNNITSISNLILRSRVINLSHNSLSSLVNVSFAKGKLCHYEFNEDPYLLLSHNNFSQFPVKSLNQTYFRGIDLSFNSLLNMETDKNSKNDKIYVREFLNLSSSLHKLMLADIFFKVVVVSDSRFKLDLSNNKINNVQNVFESLSKTSTLPHITNLILNNNNIASFDLNFLFKNYKERLSTISFVGNKLENFSFPGKAAFEFFNTTSGHVLKLRSRDRFVTILLNTDSYDCCLSFCANVSTKTCFLRNMGMRNHCFDNWVPDSDISNSLETEHNHTIVFSVALASGALVLVVAVSTLVLCIRQRRNRKLRSTNPSRYYSIFFHSNLHLDDDQTSRDTFLDSVLSGTKSVENDYCI